MYKTTFTLDLSISPISYTWSIIKAFVTDQYYNMTTLANYKVSERDVHAEKTLKHNLDTIDTP